MRRLFFLVFILFCMLLGVSFTTLNAEPVAVDYYLGVRNIPLSLALVGSLFIGVLLGALGSITWVMNARRDVGRLKKAERSADSELKALRTMPLKDV